MTETLYPNGYSGQVVTLDRLRAIHEPKMHPEYARRFFALVVEGDGILGIGGGWRSTDAQRMVFLARHVQVSSGGCCGWDGKRWALKPGMAHAAPPGASFHESQTFTSGVEGYQAVDIVGRNGKHSEAQAWMRDNEARFGLRSFYDIGNEPWHVQCFDIPLGVSKWKAAGRPDPSSSFLLPGDEPITPPEVEPPEEDDDMPGPEYIRTPPTGSPKGWPFFYVRGGDVRYADGGDVEYAKANGIPIGPDPDATKAGERYRFLHLSVVGREPGQ